MRIFKAKNHTYGLILAGGGGTRLWPKSRKKTPKQFLHMTDEKTMMQLAADRLLKIIPKEQIIVITNKRYKEEVEKELPFVKKQNILLEPEKRDTALAMLTGALYAKSLDKEAVVINSASDHVVVNEGEFVRVMTAAAKVATRGENLVTVGISPTHPATGFGYIKIGDDLERVGKGLSLFKVVNFTEKPNKSTAVGFLATGKYYWNANMYVWKASTLLSAFEKHRKDFFDLTKSLHQVKPKDFSKHLPRIYKKAKAISIDYAISEKANNLVLIPGDFGWDDVGDWKVVYELGKKNSQGNVILSDSQETDFIPVNTKNCLIHGDGRLIATIGLEDMIIVDTKEILMIAPKERSQEVKKIVEKLKDKKQDKYL